MARRPSLHTTLASRGTRHTPLCAGCRAKEARYGFRAEGTETDPATTVRARSASTASGSKSTGRRRLAQHLARGWNAAQAGLPLEDTLNELRCAAAGHRSPPVTRSSCRGSYVAAGF